MCFFNFWCASVCFSGVESQMQLRVWMSKAFSDAFREVFKVGTILCWYCSSSLSFFQPLCYLYFFLRAGFSWLWTRRGYIFLFSYRLRINLFSCFCIFFSFVTGLLSAQRIYDAVGEVWGTVAVLCGLLCSAVNGCPHKCSCSGSHVDCQGQGFRTVPGEIRGMPRDCKYFYYRVIWIPIM